CNIPFAQLGAQLGYDAILKQARAFGFESEFQVPMAVTPSVFPRPESEAQLMLQSFGQGNDRVTPLQMAMVSAAIANGGELLRPNLVERVSAPDLSVLHEFRPEAFGRSVSPDVAASLTQLMVANVANGAAGNA